MKSGSLININGLVEQCYYTHPEVSRYLGIKYPTGMIIDDNQSIREIQQLFREDYPFLKIEFFKNAYESNTRSQLHPDQMLGEIRTVTGARHVEVASDMTVLVLEQMFLQVFGLYVMIFRKAKDVWLPTMETNFLTLGLQNHKGAQSQAVV